MREELTEEFKEKLREYMRNISLGNPHRVLFFLCFWWKKKKDFYFPWVFCETTLRVSDLDSLMTFIVFE
jgi:hypothetical protein